MLVENTLEVGEIYIFFMNGIEFTGKIKQIGSNLVTINQPLQVTLVRGADGKPAKALMPMSMLNPEGDINIYLSQLSGFSKAPKEVENAWISETSNLVLATGSGNLGVLKA